MATPGSQDPIDTLQLMLNEVLIYTGKAVRASRKDGQGNVAQAHGKLKNKLPDTVRTFHYALDEIENEIIRAKSVVLRDLTELQQKRQPVPAPPPPVQPQQQPQPIESQSKSPMVIDIDSSSPVNDQLMAESKPIKQQMAPFPDMGMGLSDENQTDIIIKDEPSPLIPATSAPQDSHVNTTAAAPPAPPAPMAPMPPMDQNSPGDSMELTGADDDVGNPELNFTNMEFTLAPTNNETQHPATTQEPSFDLTTFAPADGGDDLSIENLLPQNPTAQANTNPQPAAPEPAPDNQTQPMENEESKHDSTFDDLFGIDDGAGFNVEDMGNTFDDLMDDRGDEQWIEHGDFDTKYFGLDNYES
ncbi:Fc.00g076140.m01.CDS01 [Cosmosporella sp. VM-42]